MRVLAKRATEQGAEIVLPILNAGFLQAASIPKEITRITIQDREHLGSDSRRKLCGF